MAGEAWRCLVERCSGLLFLKVAGELLGQKHVDGRNLKQDAVLNTALEVAIITELPAAFTVPEREASPYNVDNGNCKQCSG